MGGLTLAHSIGVPIVESFNTLARNISTTIGTYLLTCRLYEMAWIRKHLPIKPL